MRQQYFLATELRKVTSAGILLNPFKLQRALKAVSSALETDPGLDLLKFAQQVQNLSAGNVHFATIPITGTPAITVNGNQVSIVAVDTAAMPAFIDQVIGQPDPYTRATPAVPDTVTVQVVNGGGANGAATTGTTALTRFGFHTLTPGDTNTTSTTTVEYPPGLEAQAKAVAEHVPGAIPVATRAVKQVTVVLGTDGHQVSPFRDASPSATNAAKPRPTAPSTSSPAQAFSKASCIN